MLGFGSISESAISEIPRDFRIDFDERPLVETVSFFNKELIAAIAKYPDDLQIMNRRDFEKLIAELWAARGYDVELTQQTRDGGKDIIAINKRDTDLRFLIECKRPDRGNIVGVGAVRELLGVQSDERATKAILATTSYFSRDAILLQERNKWILDLKNYDSIMEWIKQYVIWNNG